MTQLNKDLERANVQVELAHFAEEIMAWSRSGLVLPDNSPMVLIKKYAKNIMAIKEVKGQ